MLRKKKEPLFIGKYNCSVILTYLGVAFAIAGMHFALMTQAKYAMICLVLAGICDLFDGKVARMCKRSNEAKLFGIEIDSLADMVGFVVFPVVFGYSLGLQEWYHILGYILLVLAGITRLGYFNISVSSTNKDTPVKCYSGLPVTTTSVIVPVVYLISKVVTVSTYHIIYIVTLYLVAFFFVFNIKIPKPKGMAYPIFGICGVIGVILLFLL